MAAFTLAKCSSNNWISSSVLFSLKLLMVFFVGLVGAGFDAIVFTSGVANVSFYLISR